jgi:hypothetical protein
MRVAKANRCELTLLKKKNPFDSALRIFAIGHSLFKEKRRLIRFDVEIKTTIALILCMWSKGFNIAGPFVFLKPYIYVRDVLLRI